jgi:hypothetical protein
VTNAVSGRAKQVEEEKEAERWWVAVSAWLGRRRGDEGDRVRGLCRELGR